MILAGTLPEICQPKTDMSLAPRGALFTEPDTLRNIYKKPVVAEAVQPAVGRFTKATPMLVQMMATARVEARYPREMKKQRAGVRNERRFRQLAVVCPKCKKLVSPPDLLAEHFAALELRMVP